MKKHILKNLFVICILLSAFILVLSSCVAATPKSAYDIAVENGFVGTEAEWLESLKVEAKSAYDIAVENGFEGTEAEWLESLQGLNGVGISNVTVDYRGYVVITLEDGTKFEVEVTDTSCTHDYEVIVKTPECDIEGYTSYTCKDCGHSYVNSITEAKGHHFVDGACLFCLEPEPYEGPEYDVEWYDAGSVNLTISTAKELAGLAYLVNGGTTMAGKRIALDADIDLNGVEWIPIGTSEFPFAGELDGKELTVSHLTINTDISNVGLFGYVTGTVKRLNVTNANVTVTGKNENVGIVIGYSMNAVDGCTAEGYLSAADSGSVGGVVGYCKSAVNGCKNSAEINGIAHIGGIVGKCEGVITACENTGDVIANYEVGGICGQLGGTGTSHTITNTGNVSAKHSVGGIFGYATSSSTLKDSTSSAAISGEYRVGGLVGIGSSLTISNCSNAGSTITATGYLTHSDYIEASVGGYAGIANTVTGCINEVSISYNSLGDYVGGIAGRLDGSVSYCANKAEIYSSRDYVGGIAGSIAVNLGNCTNDGDISGRNKVGGITGYIKSSGSQTISYITNNGTVTGTSCVAGLIGELYHYTNVVTTYVISVFENINNGNVSGVDQVSGLYGRFYADNVGKSSYGISTYYGYAKATVYRVVNGGNISGKTNVGEVFGYFYTDAASTLAEYVAVFTITVDGASKAEGTLVGSSSNLTIN